MKSKKSIVSALMSVVFLLSTFCIRSIGLRCNQYADLCRRHAAGLESGQFPRCDGPDETSWGNPVVTQAFIQQIAAQGFKSIRIPVTWVQHTGPASSYTVIGMDEPGAANYRLVA